MNTRSIHGKKTYFVACLFFLFAVVFLTLGKITGSEAIQLILLAAGFAGLRHGIQTDINKIDRIL